MIKNLFIALAFTLMLINPSISLAAESPIDVQEIFTSSENIDGDNFKYPKGKAEMRLIRVEVEGADHGFMCDQRESFDKDASLIGWNLLMKEFN